MIMYLTARTKHPDIVIDYIEVKFSNEKVVSLSWDESDITRYEDGFNARYKGIYFNEEYANGRIGEMFNMEIVEVGVYYEDNEDLASIDILEIEIDDNNIVLTMYFNTELE
jgi:hypothetical protein